MFSQHFHYPRHHRTKFLTNNHYYCRSRSELSRISRTSKGPPMLLGICWFRATWRLSIVFLVCYLSYPLNSGALQRILLTSSCSS